VRQFLDVVGAARMRIDSVAVDGLKSDQVLAVLAPGLLDAGYTVEASKTKADRIRRPVLFGEHGKERVAYEVDAIHDQLGVVVEIEAGRGARGNAVYRDLIRASLLVDARYLALGVMREYRCTGTRAGTKRSRSRASTTRRACSTPSTRAAGCSYPSKVCCSSATKTSQGRGYFVMNGDKSDKASDASVDSSIPMPSWIFPLLSALPRRVQNAWSCFPAFRTLCLTVGS
jgi:hypothetical protein